MNTDSNARKSCAIPERSGMSYADFAAEFLYPNKPVLLTDGLKEWKAVGKWTPDFFRQRYRDKSITISGRNYEMGKFIDLVEQSGSGAVAPYFRNEQVRLVFPELLDDLKPAPAYILPNWLRGPFYPSEGREAEIYIGGSGGQFPFLHYDGNSTHAFLGQIYGDKEAILYSPSDTHCIYPKDFPRNHSYLEDIENVDAAKYPNFSAAVAHRGILRPGSLLFIPHRWWHTARMLSPSITISYNVANKSNWHNLSDEICYRARRTRPAMLLPLRVYLAMTGWAHGIVDAVV